MPQYKMTFATPHSHPQIYLPVTTQKFEHYVPHQSTGVKG